MVDIHQAWPYFCLMLGALALASLPPFRRADPDGPQPGKRADTLDGLRGFLAISVFATHAAVNYQFLDTGVWKPSPARFYNVAGVLSVCLFFMLTGYLFWNKLLRAGGRPNWTHLYIGRVFRLGPMYVFVVLLMLGIVAYRTGFELRVPLGEAIASALLWLALGILPGPSTVNGLAHADTILAGVTWTLFFEWLFYFSLPLWAFFVRRGRHLLFVASVCAGCLALIAWTTMGGGFEPGVKPRPALLAAAAAALVLMLFAGMLVASLLHEGLDRKLRFERPAWALLALGCLGALFLLLIISRSIGIWQLLPLVPMAATFFLIVCGGNNVFGLLSLPASRHLSSISYSIYLSQGPVLVAIFALPGAEAYALSGTGPYWLVTIGAGLVLVASALTTYLFIEEPGMALGKRVSQRFSQRAAAASSLPAATSGRTSAPVPAPAPD